MSAILNEGFGGHLTEKNKKLLNDALSYYGGRDFITALLTDTDFEAEKTELFENFKALMELANDPTMQLNLEVVRSAPLFSDKYSAVISAVQSFWKEVERQDVELAAKVYANLFDTNPEYLKLFAGEQERREHQLMAMFRHVISGLDQFQKLTEEIRVLGHKHVALGVPYDGFDQMWNAMDNALTELYGLRYRRQVRKSMGLVFNHLADILRSCYPAGAEEKDSDTEEAYENVKQFWKSVEPQQELISHSLYESLFELHPEYEDLFTGEIDEIETKVMGMFRRVITGLENFDQLESEMSKLGKMHLAMGVPPEAFKHMWNSLDITLMLVFGMQYNSRVRKTLSNVFSKLIAAMLQSYPDN